MVPSASIPAVRQNRSKLTETASQALSTAPIPAGGKAVNGVIAFFMALLSFRGISTPSLPAQGEQRRSSYFNIPRGNPTRDRRHHQLRCGRERKLSECEAGGRFEGVGRRGAAAFDASDRRLDREGIRARL